MKERQTRAFLERNTDSYVKTVVNKYETSLKIADCDRRITLYFNTTSRLRTRKQAMEKLNRLYAALDIIKNAILLQNPDK